MRFLLSILLLGFMLDGVGQITFEKNITGVNGSENMASFLQPTPDGGFAIVGSRFHNGDTLSFLMKTNHFGDTTWVKYYNLNCSDLVIQNLIVLDDGFIFSRNSKISGSPIKGIVIKTDLTGEILWSKSYGDSFPLTNLNIIQSSQGGFVISGTGISDIDSHKNALGVLKINSAGDIEWNKKYSEPNLLNKKGFELIEINGKFYLAMSNSILKLSENGGILGSWEFPNLWDSYQEVQTISKSSDNCIFIALNDNNFTKMDTIGNILLAKRLVYEENTQIQSINVTNDGGFSVGWYSADCGNVGCDLVSGFSVLNGIGDEIFVYRYPTNVVSKIPKVVHDQANQFTFIMPSVNNLWPDFIQTNAFGNTSCHPTLPSISNNTTNTNITCNPVSKDYVMTNSITLTTLSFQTYRLPGLILTACNSIANLNSTETIYVSACGSYTLNGETYTSSDNYTQLVPNQSGTFDTLSLVVNILENSSGTKYLTACDYYPIGNDDWATQSQIFEKKYIIQNAAGCDSILDLDLTIIPRVYITIYDTVCPGYNFQNLVYNNAGIFQSSTENGPLCDTTFTLHLTMYDWNTASITSKFNILIAPKTNATYQWIDCATNTPIPGATNQTFAPSFNGSYAVEMSFANCQGTTDCFEYVYVELPPTTFEIFPNPFTSEAKIVFNVPQSNTKIQLLDVLGKELQSVSFSGTEFTIYRESLSASMYFVQITDASGKVLTKKIVLE